jgi:hypothetical protein
LPVTGQSTAFQVTPLVGSPVAPFWPRPSAAAAARLRSMWLLVGQVAHSSTMVATIVLLCHVTCTHMPQNFPWPKVPMGKAAKKVVPVFWTVSVMLVGQMPPLVLPVSVPQYPQNVLKLGQPLPVAVPWPKE